MSHSHRVYSRHRNPHTELCFFKPFYFLQGISSFLPARSHSSVSVALDRASSNSGSRVVTSSWRVSIGFCLGTNTLPVETAGKDDEEWREGDDLALMKWRGSTLTSAKSEETGTCKSSEGFMRCSTNPTFYKKCLLVNVTRYSHITATPILSSFHSHKTAWLPSAVWLWVCALKPMEPFQDKAAVSLIFTCRFGMNTNSDQRCSHNTFKCIIFLTPDDSLITFSSFTLKLVFSDLYSLWLGLFI